MNYKKKQLTAAIVPSPSGRVRVGIKICGMKYPENIEQVAALQPDYLGFIFYEKSARFFDSEMPKLSKSIKKVGVFVNETSGEVIKKVKTHQLQAVQLHGDESPAYCSELKQLLENSSTNPFEIIKVFSVENDFNFDVLKPFETVCNFFLFDTKGALPGGNGYTFNWNVLNNYPSTKPFFLSGGIGLEEVEKINAFKLSAASKYCYAIDVNSKFEIAPGLKNIELLKEFKKITP